MKKNILVIAAHPDDEVLGCGGTIKRLIDEGNEVHIAILGEGITARYDKREYADAKNIEALQEVCCKVSSSLGAKDVFACNLPDNRFDTVPLLEIVKKIELFIGKCKPSIIFTHHGSDLNVDHQVTHRAVLTSTRPTGENKVREIYMFEVPSSTEWSFGQFKPSFSPNVFYDISKTLAAKIEMLSLYKDEIRDFPHPRSLKAVAGVAQKWGSVIGVEAAEAFELVRSIK